MDIIKLLFTPSSLIGIFGALLTLWYGLLPWFLLRVAKKNLKAQEETNTLLRQLIARAPHLEPRPSARPTAPPIPRP